MSEDYYSLLFGSKQEAPQFNEEDFYKNATKLNKYFTDLFEREKMTQVTWPTSWIDKLIGDSDLHGVEPISKSRAIVLLNRLADIGALKDIPEPMRIKVCLKCDHIFKAVDAQTELLYNLTRCPHDFGRCNGELRTFIEVT